MKITLSEEKRILKQFDSYVKQCCTNYLLNIKEAEKRRRKRETLILDFQIRESMKFKINSGIEISDFIINGNKIFIENTILLSALCSINEKEQELILLKYFIGYSDEELSEQMNIPRRTVTYKKGKIIQKVRRHMEETK